MIGIASRYFFAPYAFFLWISALVIYGRKVALQTLPSLIISGIFFIAYYAFNQYQTEFGTGMQRLQAAEGLLYLFVNFVLAISSDLPKFLLVFVIFLLISRSNLEFDFSRKSFDLVTPPTRMLAAAGACFLILTFVLRAHTQIEMYSTRTIAYGMTFLIVGIASVFVRVKTVKNFTFMSILLVGFLSLFLSDYLNSRYMFHSMTFQNFNFNHLAVKIKNYKAKFYDEQVDAVVTFYVPEIGQLIARDAEQYYGPSTALIFPYKGPRWVPETLPQFKKRVTPFIDKKCVVDFTNFENIEALKTILYSKTNIDYRFNGDFFSPEIIGVPKYNNELADFFINNFKPSALIPCKAIL
jgi:uncharacterized membrane protein HdeD (DUF308 family)